MTLDRTHPFDLLFGGFRAERFPAIRAALGDGNDVHAFVLVAPAVELLRELRPDEGVDDGIDDFVALVHAAYLYWRDGEQTTALDEPATRALTRPEQPALSLSKRGKGPLQSRYVQLSPHIVWGQLDVESAFEPLDGWFAFPVGDVLRMVACFGVHPLRPGVSVVALQGAPPMVEPRTDGSAPFAPTMPGGNAANLFAVNTPAELLLLGWRATKFEEGA